MQLLLKWFLSQTDGCLSLFFMLEFILYAPQKKVAGTHVEPMDRKNDVTYKKKELKFFLSRTMVSSRHGMFNP